MITWIRQGWLKVDRDYILVQEFFGLAIFSVLITAIVVFLLCDRLVRKTEMERYTELQSQELMALEQARAELKETIGMNAICQYLDITDYIEAVEAVESRYDSVQFMYNKLSHLGWRFVSLDDFQSRHLPADWSERLWSIASRITEREGNLALTAQINMTKFLGHESYVVNRTYVLRWVLAVLFIMLFPLRWILLYGIKRRGLKVDPSL
jgi:hypothetical protein